MAHPHSGPTKSMRVFYLAYPAAGISETPSRISGTTALAGAFPLSWSHYVLLVRRAHSHGARCFYESTALRDGWSVRQLRRQIDSQFYERSILSRSAESRTDADQAAFSNEPVAPLDEIKDPYVLEFLDLKDDYTENDLEEGLTAAIALRDAQEHAGPLPDLRWHVAQQDYSTELT
jgi:hypothetical protein